MLKDILNVNIQNVQFVMFYFEYNGSLVNKWNSFLSAILYVIHRLLKSD